ncbi:MAG: hypothetical protein N2508_15465, partial [Anaerolineae bacterium]|nr:hypothetical protein [Anaerolineae bacterium]
IYPLAPEQPLDEAAQAIWSAFDAVWALQLSHPLCTAWATVEVTVTARRAQNEAIFRATVSIADLIAHYAGNLSAEAFIERVDFSATYLRPE